MRAARPLGFGRHELIHLPGTFREPRNQIHSGFPQNLVSTLKRTMKRWSAIFVAVFVAGLCYPALSAGEDYPDLSDPPTLEESGDEDVAVIVAVEEYWDLPDVPGAIEAGNDWEIFFERALGVSTIHYLDNRRGTRDEMIRFTERAADEVGEEGTLWYVFIGHGAPADEEGDDGVFVGANARQNPDSLRSNGVRQQELLELLNEGDQAQTVLVADTCFSGRDTEGEALIEAMPVVPTEIAPEVDETPTAVLSAARAEEFAGPLPGAERPAFSYLALGALQGWAGDGEITPEIVARYAQRQLRGLPGRFPQTPTAYGDRDVVLADGASREDPRIRDLIEDKLRQEEGEEIKDPDEVECPDGKTATRDTRGNCCWPGQVWSVENEECIGVPRECPSGHEIDVDGQSCELKPCRDGQIRVDGVHCCWEGQEWSSRRSRCLGIPTDCPMDMEVDGESCVPTVAEEPDDEAGEVDERRALDPPEEPDDEADSRRSTVGKTLTGVGTAGLIGAGGLGAAAVSTASEVNEEHWSQSAAAERYDRANDLALGGGITAGVGALVTGFGIYLWRSDDSGEESTASLTVREDGTVLLEGRW